MQETGRRRFYATDKQQRPSGKYVQKFGSYVPLLEEESTDGVVSARCRMEHERLAHQAFNSGKSEKPESGVQRPFGA